jgi:hypothetical protein
MDLVDRLRISLADSPPLDRAGVHIVETCNEAADELTRLRAVVAAAVEETDAEWAWSDRKIKPNFDRRQEAQRARRAAVRAFDPTVKAVAE